jgi:hypothetical protein
MRERENFRWDKKRGKNKNAGKCWEKEKKEEKSEKSELGLGSPLKGEKACLFHTYTTNLVGKRHS